MRKRIKYDSLSIIHIQRINQARLLRNGTRISFGDPELDRERWLYKNKDGSLVVMDDGGGSDLTQEFIEDQGPVFAYQAWESESDT
jgi:hypothetical protein